MEQNISQSQFRRKLFFLDKMQAKESLEITISKCRANANVEKRKHLLTNMWTRFINILATSDYTYASWSFHLLAKDLLQILETQHENPNKIPKYNNANIINNINLP